MITEKTLMTWLSEFNRIGLNKPKESDRGMFGLEHLVKIQGEFAISEPMFIGLCAQLFSGLKIENPLSGAMLALSIYHDCLRRQNESDKLEKEIS